MANVSCNFENCTYLSSYGTCTKDEIELDENGTCVDASEE